MTNKPPAELAPIHAGTDARAFWFGLVNYEQRSADPRDLKLDRMTRLLACLGAPQDRLRILHVAGSKGKGSTSAMLASILRQAGYRTGLFTSPHLTRAEERFLVDDRPISQAELTCLLEEIRALAPAFPGLTFFEVSAAVGFLHFVRRRVDVAIVEVGLGGRFDSTNVCRPLISVITNISIDHTRQLGDRLGQIAFEKAGIVKPGRPTVSGATAPEARAVIEEVCRRRGAPLEQLGRDIHYHYTSGRVGPDATLASQVEVVTPRGRWPRLKLSLLGEHQAANASLAIACVERLRQLGWTIRDEAVARGLATASWPARMEVLGREPLVVLDCAHNVASAGVVVQTLLASFPPTRRLLVFAASADKDLPGMARTLAPHFAHAFVTRYTGSSRGAEPEPLADLFRDAGLPTSACPTPAEAWQAARALASPEDLICVTGSVFLAGELRPLLLAGSACRSEPVATAGW